MKRSLLLLLSLGLTSCGGGSSTPSFPGVWTGSFDSRSTDCPFAAVSNPNNLFPMTINEEAAGALSVRAADGSLALGGQGPGEVISFSAQAASFGDFGSTRPYVCNSTASVGYVGSGDNEATVSVVYLFDTCTLPGSSDDTFDCFVTYLGQATKN